MPNTENQDLDVFPQLIENLVEYTNRNGYQDWLAEQETGLPCSDILCNYSPGKGCRDCEIAPESCAKPCCDG